MWGVAEQRNLTPLPVCTQNQRLTPRSALQRNILISTHLEIYRLTATFPPLLSLASIALVLVASIAFCSVKKLLCIAFQPNFPHLLQSEPC